MTETQPEGYLAMPTNGKGDPILVLPAWWGLNDTIRDFCNRLAEAGFIVFAPDLYHGKIADTIADAEALSHALRADKANADIADAIKFLNDQTNPNVSGLAVIGFSLGAYFALDLSETNPDQIHSVVVFYGTRPAITAKPMPPTSVTLPKQMTLSHSLRLTI